MTEMKYKKGTLLLADVVNYTSQANKLGPDLTDRFNKNFEEKLRDLTGTYNGEFIKRIGDAVLIFFECEEKFLDFAIELRERSKNGDLDFDDFFAQLRIVSHFGKFSFDFSDQKITDLIGPEGIQVFRIEKYAHAYDVLVTEMLFIF
jgi:class 3 adenylate cyclase